MRGATVGSSCPSALKSHQSPWDTLCNASFLASYTDSQVQDTDVKVCLPISGERLFLWLLAHFPCRLFADPERKRCLSPKHLFRVHPSPIVAQLLRQQHELKEHHNGLEQQTPHKCLASLGFHELVDHICPRGQLDPTVEEYTYDSTCKCDDTASAGSGGTAIAAGTGVGMPCVCETVKELRGSSWVGGNTCSTDHGGKPAVSCMLDAFSCFCKFFIQLISAVYFCGATMLSIFSSTALTQIEL